MSFLKTIITSGLIFACSICFSQQNGNWWVSLKTTEKVTYILGYWDGRSDEAESWSSILNTMKALKIYSDMDKIIPTAKKVADNERLKSPRSTVGNYVSGIDLFYNDYQNMTIPVYCAYNIVTKRICGDSEDKIQQLIIIYRRASSSTQ